MRQTIASPSILTMQMGNKDTDGLIASVDRGILVTGFNGGNSNSTTGDFSYGVEGFLIEKGKLTQPISAHILQLACSFSNIRRGRF